MKRNVNVGVMGHVDSGKTTICKWLSDVASTACFDKSPQSQQRGTTLDLGFSKIDLSDDLQATLVDCPGHASLFRMVVGAANIIDIVLLIVDAVKGVQAQTAECLVLAEMICDDVIICVNKVDSNDGFNAQKLTRQLAKTRFKTSPILTVSAKMNKNKEALLACIKQLALSHGSNRNVTAPFIMAIDHGFTIKGQQGSILTGTILQGSVSIGDMITLDITNKPAKVKSMQSFKIPIVQAVAGDRIGIACDIGAVKVERSLAFKSKEMPIKMSLCFLMSCTKVSYFKERLKSNQKLHISILHETVLCKRVIFAKCNGNQEYEWVDHLDDLCDQTIFAVVELESKIPIPFGLKCVATKMDMSLDSKQCRLAFYGTIVEPHLDLATFNLFKPKQRHATVERVVDANRAIGQGLVRKGEGLLNKFIGWTIVTDSTINGKIVSPFGTTGKFNLSINNVKVGDKLTIIFKKYPLKPGKPCLQ